MRSGSSQINGFVKSIQLIMFATTVLMWNIAFVLCGMLWQLMDQKNKYQTIMQVSEYKPVAVMNVFSGIC